MYLISHMVLFRKIPYIKKRKHYYCLPFISRHLNKLLNNPPTSAIFRLEDFFSKNKTDLLKPIKFFYPLVKTDCQKKAVFLPLFGHYYRLIINVLYSNIIQIEFYNRNPSLKYRVFLTNMPFLDMSITYLSTLSAYSLTNIKFIGCVRHK
jgi:hypothetical protein